MRSTWIDSNNIYRYNDSYVQATHVHPMENLGRLIREEDFSETRVGLELENYCFSTKAYLVLRKRLHNTEFPDATALVDWRRKVESEVMLVHMRSTARISEKIIDGILERARPSLRTNELVTNIYRHRHGH